MGKVRLRGKWGDRILGGEQAQVVARDGWLAITLIVVWRVVIVNQGTVLQDYRSALLVRSRPVFKPVMLALSTSLALA